MPYKTVAELPDAVKVLPDDARDGWMKAYNAAYKQYKGDEGKCAAVAWSAVEKMGYKKNDRGKWVKMESYIKDILYVGKFPHPQNENEVIDMTIDKLQAIADNSKNFIEAGGKIPLTVSHPKKEEEKIDTTEGYVTDVYVDDNKLFMKSNLNDKASQWVKDGKLQTVSPGIYHDVTTSVGKFPVLIDHVALTASPHLLAQGNFIPIIASRYSSGAVFFENNAVSFDVSLFEQFKGWVSEKFEELKQSLKTDNQVNLEKQEQEGDDMELKEAQDKITQLETDNKKLQADLDAVNVKVAEYDKKEKEALEAQSVSEKQAFEAKVDALVKDMKVKPENKVKLMAEYEQLKSIKAMEFEGKKVSIADYLLGRFADMKPANENTVPVTGLQLRVEQELFDLNTIEGKDKLYELSMARAQKIAAEKNIDNPKEVYETARQLVLNEHLVK